MILPFEDKRWFIPVEDKPIKLVFEGESADHFAGENFKRIVGYETMSPLSKAVNDSVDALVDAWKGFSKSFNSIYGKNTLEYKKDIEYWWKIACEDYLKNMEGNQLKITNYTYDKPVTRIEWSDGTVTKVSCNPDEADQWTGFLACIAKRFLGNDVIKEWEKYTITIPAQKKAEEERMAEEERIAAKKKAKHDKWVARCEKIRKARELARQYEEEQERKEVEKIAVKKFGVPESYFDK